MSQKSRKVKCGVGCVLAMGLSLFFRSSKIDSKNRVEFCKKSIGALRCSLATLYDDVRRRAIFFATCL